MPQRTQDRQAGNARRQPEYCRGGGGAIRFPGAAGVRRAGASFTVKARIAEILGGADFGLAMSLINTQNVANHLARSADATVAQRYVPDLVAGRKSVCTALTEPGAGSDFAVIQTIATSVDGNWRLRIGISNALDAARRGWGAICSGLKRLDWVTGSRDSAVGL